MLLKRMMLPLVAAVLLSYCGTTKKASRKKDVPPAEISMAAKKIDTTKKTANAPKPYKEVITAKAITDAGLFKVHKVDEKYFFEIPDSLLNREILIVNRISKAATYSRGPRSMSGYAGDEIGESVVSFSKGPNNKVFIKQISYFEQSKDTTENGMYRSVRNSNLQPIVASFDIKAFSPDSMGVVLDMTDYINGDNEVLFFRDSKKEFDIGAFQADKSYIDKVKSFPMNVEISTVKTYALGSPYAGAPLAKTYELNSSLILLSAEPMHPRYFDDRVGYFATGYTDFDANPQGVEYTGMITRWRLEPKEEDIEKYKKGELVEPKKPIVFYIDPATPKKWVPFLIQGVNDWQKSFEKAGFKNAIYALEAPKNDPNWSLEDARHNAIVYKPSAIANASGPHVHDPRSGEILETHVNWYHNVMQLLHDWYMVQAGAIDPKARKMEFDDSLMGQLIRFVSSHEIGHTLGLRHNFGASSTVPVDSLRNKKWVEANGICPSIMDYARFNYVAQPEDNISEKGIFPRIGTYDDWAIEWGYKWLPALKTPKEEKAYLNKWLIDRTSKDKRLWFGTEEASEDPRCQSEDLGDNAVQAGEYGIKNLQRIMPHLIEWTKESGENYGQLKRMQKAVMDQYSRYLFHVTRMIAGIYFTPKTMDQPGTVFQFPSRMRQKEAVRFLEQELFTTPVWILDKKIFALTGSGVPGNILAVHMRVLRDILSYNTLEQFQLAMFYQPKEAYKASELLSDLHAGIWSELKDHKLVDVYRRNLQKAYVMQLIDILYPQGTLEKLFQSPISDVLSLVKGHIRELLHEINSDLPFYKDVDTRAHLEDMRDRLKEALEPKRAL